MNKKMKGFSLAELLISLLVISLVLSAAIPAITKKSGQQRELIWRWTDENDVAFSAVGANQGIILGTSSRPKTTADQMLIDNDTNTQYFKASTNEWTGDNRNKIGAIDTGNTMLSDFGDKLMLLKRKIDDNSTNLENSHISFFNMDGSANASSMEYGGRLAMDKGNIALGIGTLQSMAVKDENDKPNIGENTAVGHFALLRNTTGARNTALGKKVLSYNDTGSYNTAAGFGSLFWLGRLDVDGVGHTAGKEKNFENTAFGAEAGHKLRVGNGNTVIGAQSLKNTLKGYNNTAVGYIAMPYADLKSGVSKNTAVGAASLYSLEEGDENTALGVNTCQYLTGGSNNICIGYNANENSKFLVNTSDGDHYDNDALFIGGSVPSPVRNSHDVYAAPLISGHTRAELAPTDLKENAFHHQELEINARKIKFYSYAGRLQDPGIDKPIFQFDTCYGAGSCSANYAVNDGYETVGSTLAPRQGVATFNLYNSGGADSSVSAQMYSDGSSFHFDAFDPYKTYSLTNPAFFTDMHINKQLVIDFPTSVTGDNLKISTVKYNNESMPIVLNNHLFVSDSSVNSMPNLSIDAGGFEVNTDAIGHYSGGLSYLKLGASEGSSLYMNITSGDNGSIFNVSPDGFMVNFPNGQIGIKGGNNSGIQFGDKVWLDKDTLYVENLTYTSQISSNSTSGSMSNILEALAVDIGSAYRRTASVIPEIEDKIAWTPSDARLKNISGDNTAGLKEINKLEVKDFTYKNDKEKTKHVGVVAQQLMKIFPNAVSKDKDGYYRIRTEDIFYAMVNSIKELCAQLQELTAKITGLDKRLTELEAENKLLKEKNAAYEKRFEALEKRQLELEKKAK